MERAITIIFIFGFLGLWLFVFFQDALHCPEIEKEWYEFCPAEEGDGHHGRSRFRSGSGYSDSLGDTDGTGDTIRDAGNSRSTRGGGTTSGK